MMSSRLSLDKRRRTYVRMIGEIQHELQNAFAQEAEKRKITRKDIADILGKDKSFVTRKFSGSTNMTLETLADLAFALDRRVKISLATCSAAAGANATSGTPKTSTAPGRPDQVTPLLITVAA